MIILADLCSTLAPASSPPVFPADDDIEEDDDLEPEDDLIQDLDDADEMAEDDAGIDLFGDNYDRDYDRAEDRGYRGADIDDDEEYEAMDPAQTNVDKRAHTCQAVKWGWVSHAPAPTGVSSQLAAPCHCCCHPILRAPHDQPLSIMSPGVWPLRLETARRNTIAAHEYFNKLKNQLQRHVGRYSSSLNHSSKCVLCVTAICAVAPSAGGRASRPRVAATRTTQPVRRRA